MNMYLGIKESKIIIINKKFTYCKKLELIIKNINIYNK